MVVVMAAVTVFMVVMTVATCTIKITGCSGKEQRVRKSGNFQLSWLSICLWLAEM
jgi:hypothetical protein